MWAGGLAGTGRRRAGPNPELCIPWLPGAGHETGEFSSNSRWLLPDLAAPRFQSRP